MSENAKKNKKIAKKNLFCEKSDAVIRLRRAVPCPFGDRRACAGRKNGAFVPSRRRLRTVSVLFFGMSIARKDQNASSSSEK